jgi:cell cycle arrest protein BUB2
MRQPRAGLMSKPSREQLNSNAPPPVPSLPTRTRANSDLPAPFERSKPLRKPLTTISNPPILSHARKSSLEVTLRDGPPAGTTSASSLSLLRHSILTSGVAATKEGMSDYRIYLWLALLNLAPLPTDEYLNLIHRGRSPAYSKIANDVFRTLATDTLFKRRVTDASLTRILNATAWRIHDRQSTDPPPETSQVPYLQGINVLSAPLLYASRSEAQAYALLTSVLDSHIPGYITPTMSGVHRGLELIDRILALQEPNLSTYLLEKVGPAKVYAFASVLTLCACTPPLPEVLKLWDFLFAFGVHMNIICVVAQLILMKQKLYDSSSPGKLLRNFPHLDAKGVIALTLVIVRDLPEDLYTEVVQHCRA